MYLYDCAGQMLEDVKYLWARTRARSAGAYRVLRQYSGPHASTGPGGFQGLLDAALAKDVYLARTKLALTGADGKEGLDGVIGEAA